MELITDNPIKVVRPDERGRINLGNLADNISSYQVFQNKDGYLILEPLVEIPAREVWIYEDSENLGNIRRGMQQSKDGKVSSLGSFSQYLNDDED